MLIVTFGGWTKLQGLKPINFGWCILYLIFAFYISRWNRGLLPIAAAFAILLLIVSLIAGTGTFGSTTSWFDRNHSGFGSPGSIFGGGGLTPDTLGLVTVLIAPVQVLLIFFGMRGVLAGLERRGRGSDRRSAAARQSADRATGGTLSGLAGPAGVHGSAWEVSVV